MMTWGPYYNPDSRVVLYYCVSELEQTLGVMCCCEAGQGYTPDVLCQGVVVMVQTQGCIVVVLQWVVGCIVDVLGWTVSELDCAVILQE